MTRDDILKGIETMKERFLQNADFLFCNPEDKEEIKKAVGDIINVRSHKGVEKGKVYLVDRKATEEWLYFSEYDGEEADE